MLSKMVITNFLNGNKKVPAGLYVLNVSLIIIKRLSFLEICSTPRFMINTSRYVPHLGVCPTPRDMSNTSRYVQHLEICPTPRDMSNTSRYVQHTPYALILLCKSHGLENIVTSASGWSLRAARTSSLDKTNNSE